MINMKPTSPLGVDHYLVADKFWSEKMELVRTKMLPYQWRVLNDCQEGCVPSHCIKNFKIAAGLEEGEFGGFVFQDSDIAKWLEAVGYSLSWCRDAELEKIADEAIDLICAAQQPDGYMDTYYIINGLDKRFTNLMDHHELYCAGHMIEAAVAYYEGTGKRKLLDAVMRLADCISEHFGTEEGKLHGYPGHEILEMALVRLYQVTGEERFLKLAEYFIDERGKAPLFFEEERKRNNNNLYWEKMWFKYKYYQADVPVREQTEGEGHAVRAMYLYSGMTGVVKETREEELWKACKRLWENVTRRQMYLTGAIGASHVGESFTFDYDLPNDTIYGETCASIGLCFWARRMLEIELDRSYAEVMERALFNGCISGMDKEGTKFFYVNPLEIVPSCCDHDEGKRHVLKERQTWFDCACCPPNLARIVTSLADYACTDNEDMIAFHMYVGGTINSEKSGVSLKVDGNLPWNGDVSITVEKAASRETTLAFRIPTWCLGKWTVKLNGEALSVKEEANGYLYMTRVWVEGDQIEFAFDLPIRVVRANPNVREDIGKIAVMRGPVVYCLEEVDNGKDLHLISMKANASFKLVPGSILDGTCDLETEGLRRSDAGWGEELYSSVLEPSTETVPLRFVPYHLWNNRGIGEMTVWVHEA